MVNEQPKQKIHPTTAGAMVHICHCTAITPPRQRQLINALANKQEYHEEVYLSYPSVAIQSFCICIFTINVGDSNVSGLSVSLIVPKGTFMHSIFIFLHIVGICCAVLAVISLRLAIRCFRDD